MTEDGKNPEEKQFPESLKKMGYTEEGLAADNPYTQSLNESFDAVFGEEGKMSELLTGVDAVAFEAKNPLVIYHGNCADGFSAAWVFHHMQDKIEQIFDFHPGVYSEKPPTIVPGQAVYLVDFSYKRSVVEEMLEVASKVIFIDHHKTAIEDLAPLKEHPKFRSYTDLNRSGALLAWDYWNNFFSEGSLENWKDVEGDDVTLQPGDDAYIFPPKLLEHVSDRDLWQFKLEGSKELASFMFSFPYTFEAWDRMMLGSVTDLLNWRSSGAAIVRKDLKDVAEFAEVAMTWARFVEDENMIDDFRVPVVNCPYMWASEMGVYLLKKYPSAPFVATYYDTRTHRVWSFRSTDERHDCSAIAKFYGGGGHRNAAGARILLEDMEYERAPDFDINPPEYASEGEL